MGGDKVEKKETEKTRKKGKQEDRGIYKE